MPTNTLKSLKLEDCLKEEFLPQPAAPQERPWKKARLEALKVPKGKPAHKAKTTVADMVHQDRDDTKPSPVFNLFGKQAREVSEAKDTLKLAVVELFAGLRTTHVAAKKVSNLKIVLSHAAEVDDFASRV